MQESRRCSCPIGEELALSGVVDLLNDTAITYTDGNAAGSEGAIPAEMEMEEHAIHDALDRRHRHR